MELYRAISLLDKSEQNRIKWIDIIEIGQELNVDLYDEVEQERLKAYWLGSWRCTDTEVGYVIYFLDDEAVALSLQDGRKSPKSFNWFSKDLAKKVRNYILSLLSNEDDLNIQTIGIYEDIGEGYELHYHSEILPHHKCTYKGEHVNIVEKIDETTYGSGSKLKIKLQSGDIKTVDIKELTFSYYI